MLLAAGQSKRMGRHKLLLPLGDGTILSKTLENILAAEIGQVYLVLGHNKDAVLAHLEEKNLLSKVNIIENPLYVTGQSSSVKVGVSALPPGHGAMFALGDQPLVSSGLYKHIAMVYTEGKAPIVLPVNSEGKRGNPTVFAPELFAEIMALKGDTGPRALLEKYKTQADSILSDESAIFFDIDNEDAYNKIKNLF